MKVQTVFISLLFAFVIRAPAQVATNDKLQEYTKGFFVTIDNDTIRGYFKKLSLTESCTKMRFKKNNEAKPIDMYPEGILSYTAADQTFISKKLELDELSHYSFVKPMVKGQLSYYARWITKSDTYGDYEVLLPYLQLREKKILSLTKANFRQSASAYLASNYELSYRIKKKDLEIYDLESIVTTYNKWYFNGAKNSAKIIKKNKASSKQIAPHKLAIEIPMAISLGYTQKDDRLREVIQVDNKVGYDLGVGVKYAVTGKIKLRLGVHHWNIPSTFSYQAVGTNEDNEDIILNVKEEGHLNNLGIYLHVQYEGKKAFFGGGINLGVSTSYSAELSFYDAFNNYVGSFIDDKSPLTSNFNKQSHLELLTGLKINTNTNLLLNPYFKIKIPLQPLYDAGTPQNTYFELSTSLLNIGLIIEIGLISKS